MLVTILYHGNLYTRDVEAEKNELGVITGMVGTATFKWDTRYYAYPAVRFHRYVTGVKALYSKHLIRLFLQEYFFLKEGNSHLNVLPFKKSESSVSNKSISVVPYQESGVPLWMKEEHKVWTKCIKKDGSSYMRRTKYKEDSKSLVDSYLPLCSTCTKRSTCLKPCISPEIASSAVVTC